MGRKKKIVQNNKKKKEEENENNPFASIVLKEKKETVAKKSTALSKAKKPSEIVQGYNPSMSFADILYSFEKTGNPYSMPKPQASKTTSKEDFGSILDKWENKGKPKAQKRVESVKNAYKPTKSFADILESYEKGTPIKRTEAKIEEKERDKVIPSTLFKEETEDNKKADNVSWSIIGGRNEEFVRTEEVKEEETKKEEKTPKRVSKPYKPSKDFSDILEEFISKDKPSKKIEEVKIEPILAKTNEKEKEIPLSDKGFFIEESEDNKKAKNVSWSIIGGKNEDFVRDEAINVDIISNDSQDKKTLGKNEYKPTKDFSEILSSFESNKNTTEKVETFEEILEKKGDKNTKKPTITMSRLRTLPPQATLDLHGETQQSAEKLVNDFLLECKEHGLRKVCIITGKGLHSDSGEGVIRPLVDRILEQSGIVSEKNNAPIKAGGSGALWVILKA